MTENRSEENCLRGIFITGTDTGVGKTIIGASLVRRLFQAGVNVQPRKPVESGCRVDKDQLTPEDATAYYQAIDQTVALDVITPHRFSAALAPPEAAHLGEQTITISQLESAVRKDLKADDYCIVEGAGGFYSPIAEDGLNADLAKILNLPILLIAADRLGCINHVLLTLQAIRSKGLECIAVVVNCVDESANLPNMNNAATLQKLISVPVIKTRHCDTIPIDVEAICSVLNLP